MSVREGTSVLTRLGLLLFSYIVVEYRVQCMYIQF